MQAGRVLSTGPSQVQVSVFPLGLMNITITIMQLSSCTDLQTTLACNHSCEINNNILMWRSMIMVIGLLTVPAR